MLSVLLDTAKPSNVVMKLLAVVRFASAFAHVQQMSKWPTIVQTMQLKTVTLSAFTTLLYLILDGRRWNAAAYVVIAAAPMDTFHSLAQPSCSGHVCGKPGACRPRLAAVRPMCRPFTNIYSCRPCAPGDRDPHVITCAAACQMPASADGLSTAVSRRAALLASLASVLGAASSIHAPPASAAGAPPGDGEVADLEVLAPPHCHLLRAAVRSSNVCNASSRNYMPDRRGHPDSRTWHAPSSWLITLRCRTGQRCRTPTASSATRCRP